MTELADRLAGLTPAQRALLDRRMRERAQAAPAPALGPVTRRAPGNDRVPLTVDQERIWLIHQFDPQDPVYTVHFASRLRGALDADALQRAVDSFVRRHEAMRTTFEQDGEAPVQVVHPKMDVPIRHVDLRPVPAERREEEMLRLATEELRAPFDIVDGPLLRVTLLKTADDEHVLVGAVDHLVWDRGSMGVFNAEIAELYSAYATGREPRLPEIEVHYPDYALWQPHWLKEEVARRHLPYWKRALAGAELVLELPTDRPRPPVATSAGARHQFPFTPRLTQAVRDLAKREGVSVFVTLLAAWEVLLHRLSGQDDIVVGTTSSTRGRPETEPMVGYFLTMLPLRSTLRPGMTVRELLQATRGTMLGAFDHSDIPFGTLLDELDLDRDPSRTPIYQSSFILVDFHHEEQAPMAGLTVEELTLDNNTAKDDVLLGVFDDPAIADDRFHALFEYNTDLFDDRTMARTARQYLALVEQMTRDAGTPVADLSLLDADETRTQLVDWNATSRPRETGLTLDALVRRSAETAPDAVAVSDERQRVEYAELLARAKRLASHLRARGVTEESVVGVCLERSADLVTALLGVLMAGGAYLPLDPEHPRARLVETTTDADARLLLTRSELLDTLADCPGARVCLDTEAAAIAAAPADPPRPALDDNRLAYVIYTSGSTGRPKGVEVSHRNLVNLLLGMVEETGLGPGDVLAAVTPLTFDIAGLELYGPLAVGGRTHVVPREVAVDGRRLAALLDDSGATVLQATPATWQLLVEAGWRPGGSLRALVGGEALPPSLAEWLADTPGGAWNVYGPTETTVWSTAHRLDDGTTGVSIGRPLANTEVYVLDERLRPVPVGMPGDLYLGGAGVARGYRRRPALTAESFLPDPFSGRPGARLYRTGDRARFRDDGTLVFLGRDDGQVKLRGFRIELGEIEAHLERHPAVRRAVALVREDRPGDRRLVGYAQLADESAATAEELRAHLRDVLPEYMVPPVVVRLTDLPLNSSGKVDRRALPAPTVERAAGAYVPPRDPVELEVAHIWERVLSVAPVGLHDRFFDLGGHSLLVLRLMAEIERRFDRRLPMAAIFRGATVERFARMLREGYQEEDDVHLVEIRSGGSGDPVFFAHPAGSEVVCYLPFASLVEGDRPLYALASPPPVDGRLPFDGFAQRAAAYAELIREVQPSGPYTLAGWCYGGANAYAVAGQLEKTGERARVVMMDAHAPAVVPPGGEPDRAEIVAAVAANLQWDYGDTPEPVAKLREMTPEQHLDHLLALARASDYLPPDAGRDQVRDVLDLWVANLRLLWNFRPESVAGPVTLIRAAEEEYDPAPSWRELTGRDVDVRVVAGNHYTMMRPPHVEEVARVLNDVLAERDQESPDGGGPETDAKGDRRA
ncbi:amino acid adenylation domain-containing protein [Streptomyces sp. OF3]|uniref:Amino acid adenylation domain-containing protein n=1 Tax=Streptomyces alkaliterrae TaxID=2213162 RepID=A0A7W3ZM31_9ACTN|nr:non-ribosomal peptide synthetase [Streptomyces alkaliterrae]MBB1253076.1 amino acid adenylation domain-containing protein [Streptomyces alkaliterrae]